MRAHLGKVGRRGDRRVQVDDLDIGGAQHRTRSGHGTSAGARAARSGSRDAVRTPSSRPPADLGQPVERRLARAEAALGERRPPQRQGARGHLLKRTTSAPTAAMACACSGWRLTRPATFQVTTRRSDNTARRATRRRRDVDRTRARGEARHSRARGRLDEVAQRRVDGGVPRGGDALRGAALVERDPVGDRARLGVAGALGDPAQQLVGRDLEVLERVGEAGELDRRVGLGGEEDAEVDRRGAARCSGSATAGRHGRAGAARAAPGARASRPGGRGRRQRGGTPAMRVPASRSCAAWASMARASVR